MDRISKERRSENMRRIRSGDTNPEMVVRRIVHGMGFRYRLHVQKLPGRPDLVLPRLKTVIQIYGCFWHYHNGCSVSHIPATRTQYWRPKLEKNRSRDQSNCNRLAELGWNLITIWECETRDLHALQDRLKAALEALDEAHKQT